MEENTWTKSFTIFPGIWTLLTPEATLSTCQIILHIPMHAQKHVPIFHTRPMMKCRLERIPKPCIWLFLPPQDVLPRICVPICLKPCSAQCKHHQKRNFAFHLTSLWTLFLKPLNLKNSWFYLCLRGPISILCAYTINSDLKIIRLKLQNANEKYDSIFKVQKILFLLTRSWKLIQKLSLGWCSL